MNSLFEKQLVFTNYKYWTSTWHSCWTMSRLKLFHYFKLTCISAKLQWAIIIFVFTYHLTEWKTGCLQPSQSQTNNTNCKCFFRMDLNPKWFSKLRQSFSVFSPLMHFGTRKALIFILLHIACSRPFLKYI